MTDPNSRYSLKKNEPEARERLRAFWAGSSLGRPAIHVTAKNPAFELIPWHGDPAMSKKEKDISPEWQAYVAENALAYSIPLAEAMPGYAVRIGLMIPLLATLAGGDYGYSTDEDWLSVRGGTAWIKPWPEVLDGPLPRFDPQHPTVRGLSDSIHGVADVVGDRGIVSPPCWVDALSTLGCLRTGKQFFIDLLEMPEKVKAWTDAATTLQIEANEHFTQQCRARGYYDTLSWFPIMAEGRMDSIQCDYSIMLSPEMFAEFVFPIQRRLTEYFDFSMYHLDGGPCMRFLDQIRQLPGLNAIQYTRVEGSEYPGECFEHYRQIRESGLSLFVHCISIEEAVAVTKEIGPDGLFICFPWPLETVGEAEEVVRSIQKAC